MDLVFLALNTATHHSVLSGNMKPQVSKELDQKPEDPSMSTDALDLSPGPELAALTLTLSADPAPSVQVNQPSGVTASLQLIPLQH